MKNKIFIVEICNSQSEVQVKTRQSHNRWNIKITNEITCDYAQEQTAAPCCMSAFYNFKMSENDQLLAQADISMSSFQRLLNKMFESIPNTAWKVSVCGVILVRIFVDSEWILYLSVFSPNARKYGPEYGHFLRSAG